MSVISVLVAVGCRGNRAKRPAPPPLAVRPALAVVPAEPAAHLM